MAMPPRALLSACVLFLLLQLAPGPSGGRGGREAYTARDVLGQSFLSSACVDRSLLADHRGNKTRSDAQSRLLTQLAAEARKSFNIITASPRDRNLSWVCLVLGQVLGIASLNDPTVIAQQNALVAAGSPTRPPGFLQAAGYPALVARMNQVADTLGIKYPRDEAAASAAEPAEEPAVEPAVTVAPTSAATEEAAVEPAVEPAAVVAATSTVTAAPAAAVERLAPTQRVRPERTTQTRVPLSVARPRVSDGDGQKK